MKNTLAKSEKSNYHGIRAYNSAGKEFRKIDKDIFRINGERLDSNPNLEKPEELEGE